jgi:hypothetical protein
MESGGMAKQRRSSLRKMSKQRKDSLPNSPTIFSQRGSNVPREVCSNDSWIADYDFGYQIGYVGHSDFFDFLAKVALNIWDDEEEIEQEDEGERSEQPLTAARRREGVSVGRG